jgi:zinc protease
VKGTTRSASALTAVLSIIALVAAPAAVADRPDAADTPAARLRSKGADRIDRMVFPPLLWRPPAVGTEVERRSLGNGIVLYLRPDRSLPLVELTGLLRGGRLYEPGAKAGLARLTASQIRAGGTATLSPEALNDELESLAISLELSARDEAIEVRLNLLSRHLERGLSLLADVLRRPAFDPGQLELARARLIEEVRRRRDDPRELLLRAFASLHYTDRHPLGLEPTEATLRNIEREDLLALHRRFVRPDNLMLAAAGDFDADALVALLEEALADWAPEDGLSLPPIPPARPGPKPGVYLIDKAVPQSSIAIGHFGVSRTSPDRHAIELMNMILGGGGLMSRLGKRVRTAEGLAYSVGSRYGTAGREPGLFQVVASTRTDATPQTISAILDEIAQLRAAPIGPAELQTAKDAVSNSFLFRFTDAADTVYELAQLEFQGLPPDYYETLLDRYRSLTSARLHETARRHLRPDDLAIVVVGDASVLGPALTPFGPVRMLPADAAAVPADVTPVPGPLSAPPYGAPPTPTDFP